MFIFTTRIYKFFADLRNVRRIVAIQIVKHHYMAPAIGHCAITWLLPTVGPVRSGASQFALRAPPSDSLRSMDYTILFVASGIRRHPDLSSTCNGLYPSNHFGEDFGGEGLFYFFVFAQFSCGAMLENMVQPLLRLDHHVLLFARAAVGFHVRCPASFPAGDTVVSNRGIIAGIRWKPFPKRLQIPLTIHLSILCPVERHHRTSH